MRSLANRIRDVLRTPAGHSTVPVVAAGFLTADPFAETQRAKVEAPAKTVSRTNGETDLGRVLGAEWRRSADASCFVVESRRDPSSQHGHSTVGALAARLNDSIEHASLLAGCAVQSPCVFFDLETTGLSGGAGTYAFLVGCGWFEADGAFATRQFFLARFADERALLTTVADDFSRAGALVTFNGKSFDAPVLETRYLYHRLPWRAASLPHLDMLHLARRFWKADDCSLIALETEILGHRRRGDVPGFEIPARYFQFVRTGDARPLAAVLEHNRLDLLSLAALTARACDLARTGPARAASAREAVALGWLYARAGQFDRACEAYERATGLVRKADTTTRCADPTIQLEALRALATMMRRARRYEDAAGYWRQMLGVTGCPPALVREATEALAVHHEHRVRDLAVARTFALRTLEYSTRPARNEAVRHRLARIERKMEK